MIYLDQFKLPTIGDEEDLVGTAIYKCYVEGYADNRYPCDIFPAKQLYGLDFSEITILYGGNGSGKSTLLNLIAEKTKIKRVSPYNKSNIFDMYVNKCSCRMGFDDEGCQLNVPNGSRIITSDDVFDYMLNVRDNNQDISQKVEPLREKHWQLAYSPTIKMTGLQDYEAVREQVLARRLSARQHVRKELGVEARLHSNGETALKYFFQKLQGYALFLLDEPENSLSPKLQQQLVEMLSDMAHYSGCQFVIATHSPFFLAIDNAKIYNLDTAPVQIAKWWELENCQIYYNFFKKWQSLFEK